VIASLDGMAGAVFCRFLIVEVAGSAIASTARRPCWPAVKVGERTRLFTHHLVREDAQALYGFRTPEELGLLRTPPDRYRVGPKVGSP